METPEINYDNITLFLPLILGEIAFLILTIYHMLKYGYRLIFFIIIIISLLLIIATIFFIFYKEKLNNLINMLLYYYYYWKEYILYKYYYSRFEKIIHFLSSLTSPVVEKIQFSISLFKKLIINTLYYIKKGLKYLIYKNGNENYLENNNNTKGINKDDL